MSLPNAHETSTIQLATRVDIDRFERFFIERVASQPKT